MRRSRVSPLLLSGLFSLGLVGTIQAADYSLKDPKGDDKGPGTYTYPTDAVYLPGSFDITEVSIKDKGKNIEIKVEVASKIEDPWDSKAWNGNGFSVQFVQVYFDLDHKAGSGETKTLPGMNVLFPSDQGWEKVVVISPQPRGRVQSEVDAKAAGMKDKIVIPTVTRAQGNSLIVQVSKADLGGELKAGFGVQALMQSNEGFPDATDLLSRKVNEYNGQHRFGGGSDFDCDPHAIDLLAGGTKGEAAEQEAQFEQLKKFTCDDDQTKWKLAEVQMVYPPEPAAAPAK
jgi:hypothetical protein